MTTKTTNLKERYYNEVREELKKEFNLSNDMQIPKLHKIVLNMGVGEASHNSKIAESIVNQLTKIAGQKALATKAKKSIASYKLREGMPNCVVLPRIRDFRGISPKSFDGRGNYTFGLKEQALFPEIHFEEVDLVKGMNVSIITTAPNDEQARALLKHLGMPFKKH